MLKKLNVYTAYNHRFEPHLVKLKISYFKKTWKNLLYEYFLW